MIQVGRTLRRLLVQALLGAGPALRSGQVSQGLIELFAEIPKDGDCIASQGSCPAARLSSWGKPFSTYPA